MKKFLSAIQSLVRISPLSQPNPSQVGLGRWIMGQPCPLWMFVCPVCLVSECVCKQTWKILQALCIACRHLSYCWLTIIFVDLYHLCAEVQNLTYLGPEWLINDYDCISKSVDFSMYQVFEHFSLLEWRLWRDFKVFRVCVQGGWNCAAVCALYHVMMKHFGNIRFPSSDHLEQHSQNYCSKVGHGVGGTIEKQHVQAFPWHSLHGKISPFPPEKCWET